MPELPEVETVLRSVAHYLLGRKIEHVELLSARVTRGDHRTAADALAGATIQKLERRGKHILFHLDRGFLHLHLGMTGKLLWEAPPGPYTRASLVLGNGILRYDDVRQFGRVEFYRELPASVTGLGPDALVISRDDFYQRLHSHSSSIKSVLLNQTCVCGLGNIYVDEALFAASIHPRVPARRLSRARVQRLYEAVREILQAAILHHGSSISDYVDAAGQSGNFQNLHLVYGKAGQPCARCGNPIRRIVVAQRGTHYCPRCQKA